MSAPEIQPDLTDAQARQRTVEHIVHTLKHLPDGWIAGFERPGRKPSGASSGPVGPEGSWNLYVVYWMQGYGDPTGDEVFSGFVDVWSSWGWIDSIGSDIPEKKSACGHTPEPVEETLSLLRDKRSDRVAYRRCYDELPWGT